jgi:hypothetical protein
MSDKVGLSTGIKPGGVKAYSERVGGYTGPKPGGSRLDSNKVGGYRIDPGTGGL